MLKIQSLAKFCASSAILMAAILAPAVQARHIDIREFGARADDGRDDSQAFERAFQQARAGDIVSVPSGRFDIWRSIDVPSDITLAGMGCGSSILRRNGKSGQIMLRFDGNRNVTIRNIGFDYNSAPEFYRAIGFRGAGSANIRIENNCFSERNFAGGRGDRWAIELSATTSPSRNLVIAGNRAQGNIQMTAGGGAGIVGARITDNRVIDARSNAIALSTLSDTARFQNIFIARNIIDTPTAIGIFVGPDKPSTRGGSFRDITIADNRITGFRNRFTYGVFLRAPAGGMHNVSITGNEIDGRGAAEPIGIRLLDDHGRGTRRFSQVRICSNVARNVGRGIWLQRVFGARVIGNRMNTDRALIASDKENSDIAVQGAC